MAEQQDMQSKKLSGNKAGQSAQRYLDINEIKEDVVVMKDGTLRTVLLVASINFALKSEDEQSAIIQSYISFLNSLEFPLQVVIQSRPLNVDNYLERLKVAQQEQQNELLRVQISDYRNFVTELISLGQIMSKQFFVVVPYNPLSDKQKGFMDRLQDSLSPALSLTLSEEKFRQRKQALAGRTDHIISALGSMGLKAVQLDTQSLIEMYYRVYNPELYDVEKLADVGKIRLSDDVTAL